ncbi:UNVERIFIED_CONTAM: hypothetical protein Sindi_0017500 [Sesamum indicum]
MISERRIETNPKKINAIMDISQLKSIKEVQKLAERLASLNHSFCDPRTRTYLSSRFKTSQEAFDELKRYLASPPLLTKPKTEEILYHYLMISENTVRSVLMRQENREHHLKVKALLPVTPSDSVDKPSFEASSPELSGRMVKLEVELSEFSVNFTQDQLLKCKC